ncbi:MAG: MFS transporter [Burkholderiaceae bacterium]|jgi:MFS family permease
MKPADADRAGVESAYAWARLMASLALMTIGGVGMYGASVVLPAVQAEFGAARADASFPYTITLVGFGIGGVLMGRLADRLGVMVVALVGALALGAGLAAAGASGSLWQFSLAHGLLIGLLGVSATFAPLVADTSLWFTRRRGIAVAICMSGNYLAGAVWPPVMQHFIDAVGWRQTYFGLGLFCVLTMLPLALVLRRRAPVGVAEAAAGGPAPKSARFLGRSDPNRPLGLSPLGLQMLLCVAGVSCCVAMSMPQVHIVAYCTDLGFGAARGAQMLSLMMAAGIASRLLSGWVSDHIGGLRTLMLGSVLQGVALLLFLPFDGLVPLYVVSGLFGLFQGGIVPSYALIVREYFTPAQAGARVGTVLMATLLGMALGGWLSGAVFDWTGTYRAAFVNGIAWNLVNVGIVGFLLLRVHRSLKATA